MRKGLRAQYKDVVIAEGWHCGCGVVWAGFGGGMELWRGDAFRDGVAALVRTKTGKDGAPGSTRAHHQPGGVGDSKMKI